MRHFFRGSSERSSEMNGTLDEPDLLTEVPPVLKRLCNVVGRGFYEDEQAALIYMLTNSKYPCVKEDDLLEMLRFDRKQLRLALMRLRNDKLVKQRTYKEKQADTGNTITFNFYFINYKLFMDVVKYKLDHIRKKIESDEKQAKNRLSFVCAECSSKYSDLEVDRLLDLDTGSLKCTMCGGKVDEDQSDAQQENSSRTSLALFNEQMEPIFKLLCECEKINLAPTILEPEPQPAQVQAAKPSGVHSPHTPGWAKSSHGVINDPGIKISMGPEDEDESAAKSRAKETPIWMKESTISQVGEEKMLEEAAALQADNALASSSKSQSQDDDILADLLVHESVSKKPRLDVKEALGETAGQDDSDSSGSETEQPSATAGEETKHVEVMEQGSDSEQEDEDQMINITVKGQTISIHEITDDMIEQMTTAEHEAYTKALQQLMEFYGQ